VIALIAVAALVYEVGWEPETTLGVGLWVALSPYIIGFMQDVTATLVHVKNSKHKPIEHASVNRLTFVPSLITSDDSDIITIIGIELNGSRSCFAVIA
jgi:hypothetical protein